MKKIIIVFVLMIVLCSATAASNVEISVDNKNEITVSISTDFEYCAASFELEYDNTAMEFLSGVFSETLGGGIPMINPLFSEKTVKCSILSVSAVPAGEICEIKFKKTTEQYKKVILKLKNMSFADIDGNLIENIASSDKEFVLNKSNVTTNSGLSSGGSSGYGSSYDKKQLDGSNSIILKIGDKEALVFGKKVVNDVAPKIVNNRTMLPIRFVAEALGAEVLWKETQPDLVVIKKAGIEINITIGSDIAQVNGKNVKLDSPSFLENDRTYLPLRFVSENLGAKVEWVEQSQQVIITK